MTDEMGSVWSCLVAEWIVVCEFVVGECVLKAEMDKEGLGGLPK